MAASLNAVAKRPAADAALMPPPPPIKKIKRPTSVLDEDDYTDALSDIIARDYFPGLQESRAQQEYLAALDSNDATWIAEAAQKLRNATSTTPRTRHTRASTSTATATGTPIKTEQGTPAADVPPHRPSPPPPQHLDTASLSLSDFQSRYTSEDNASFNDVLDKQNANHRNKHAYLWTTDQRIPTKRLLLHRAKQQQLITQHAHDAAAAKSDGRELVPLTTGSTDSRPAQPDTWKSQSPANSLMFSPASVDQDGLATQQEERERKSKAGPKAIVLENTRFPPLQYLDDDQHRHSHASSPSLNTDIINSRRDPAASTSASTTISAYPGGETPRVNGYAFVDEDEPAPEPSAAAQPSYRDLLAGQAAGDETPNPFKLSSARRRELLHHKLVDEANRKKKLAREMQPRRMPGSESAAATPGNMTPAARKLLENLAKTPARAVIKREHDEHDSKNATDNSNIWTPVRTPRRQKVK